MILVTVLAGTGCDSATDSAQRSVDVLASEKVRPQTQDPEVYLVALDQATLRAAWGHSHRSCIPADADRCVARASPSAAYDDQKGQGMNKDGPWARTLSLLGLRGITTRVDTDLRSEVDRLAGLVAAIDERLTALEQRPERP